MMDDETWRRLQRARRNSWIVLGISILAACFSTLALLLA